MSSLSIKGGHAKEAAQSSGAVGQASSFALSVARPVAPSRHQRQQVHEKLTLVAGPRALGRQQQRRRQQRQQERLGRQIGVRSLTITSALIVIAMLSHECTARAFFGQQANQRDLGGAAENNQAGFSVASATGATGPSPAEVEFALELGCKNLVESILYSQVARDQRPALDLMEFVDGDRIKRLSPKVTPRFGR